MKLIRKTERKCGMSKWNSVKDRLPDGHEDVLVEVEHGG